jgi:hypothetical protein
MWFFPYSLGLFLGIQIGKQQSPNYIYLLNKYNKVNTDYYKNHQMNYRLNK